MLLKSERVALKPVEREQIDLFLKWFNDPEVVQYILRRRPLSRAEEEEWIANLHKREEEVVFVIVALPEERLIGNCGLVRIDAIHRKATLGIAIGEKEFWGKGYGREATELLCGYGFDVLNLNRIGLCVYDFNVRGQRCYERVGFKVEGRGREALFHQGRYHDDVQMGLLASEWRAVHPGSRISNDGKVLA